MRVLWISHRADVGGAELGLVEGVKALASRGHELHVVLPRNGSLEERIKPLGQVHVCNHNPWVTRRVGIATAARWTLYNARRAVPEIAKLARATGADVIVTNTLTVPSGGFAARRARVPHVWFVHEFGKRDHGLAFLCGRRPTLRIVDRLSDVVLVISDALKRDLTEVIAEHKVTIVRYGVEVPPVATRERRGTGFRLVLVGAKAPGKGQADAIAAVGQLVESGLDVRLDLVGSGRGGYERTLMAQARALGIDANVRFIPFHDDPFGLVAESDVALMCSRSEAFGRVTVEAMKLGKPVIGAAGGATPELVRDGWNGYLYGPGDASSLAKRIVNLHDNPGRARAMGERGRSWALERFNLGTYGEDLEASLNAAVASTPSFSVAPQYNDDSDS